MSISSSMHRMMKMGSTGRLKLAAVPRRITSEARGTPAFVVTYQRGAEWAARGSVTIPVPAALAP